MIKIGIIGMSPGNAHPYSWSSIINGTFDGAEITSIGYPAVATYLSANADTLGLPAARVTHVWTQEREISESIARSSGIDKISETIEDMAAEVDAVIIARDDRHRRHMCEPFFNARIPVFIDKPLAMDRDDLDWFSEQYLRGNFFMSCSSMRYANECRTVKTELAALGDIELVTCVGKKDWLKYGVHMLEAMFSILGDPQPSTVRHIGTRDKDIVHLTFANGIHATLHLFMNISSTFQVSVYGQNGWRQADIKNSYSMFRDNIIEFIRSVQEGRPRLSFAVTHNIINTLISAEESLQQGGTLIKIKAAS